MRKDPASANISSDAPLLAILIELPPCLQTLEKSSGLPQVKHKDTLDEHDAATPPPLPPPLPCMPAKNVFNSGSGTPSSHQSEPVSQPELSEKTPKSYRVRSLSLSYGACRRSLWLLVMWWVGVLLLLVVKCVFVVIVVIAIVATMTVVYNDRS